jgi:molecular chaperone GrpE
MTIIEKDLVAIFEKNRIKKIDTQNKKFNPNLHQAMTEIEDESSETGSILQEIQAGYMLGERLLRPSLVAVAKKKADLNEITEGKKEDK